MSVDGSNKIWCLPLVHLFHLIFLVVYCHFILQKQQPRMHLEIKNKQTKTKYSFFFTDPIEVLV